MEDEGQLTEDRGYRMEDRGQRTENRRQRTNIKKMSVTCKLELEVCNKRNDKSHFTGFGKIISGTNPTGGN